MANEQANKANLGLSRAFSAGGSGTGSSRSFNPRDVLALNRARSRNGKGGLSKRIQGKAGAQIGRFAGGTIGSAVPVLGTAAGAAVGGFFGKRFGEAPLWQKIAILTLTTFVSFLPLIIALLIIYILIIIFGKTWGFAIGFFL